ncbi:MAG TPA: type II secretion system F family protein [Gammaproteobacteria bacterium]
MGLFRYKAVDGQGALLEGELEASSELDALQRLKALGHAPISATPAGRGMRWLRTPARRRRTLSVARFTRDVGTLLAAGIPLERALSMQADTASDETARALLNQMLDGVRNGQSLSEAMEAHPHLFSRFHLNMVRAGEASGALGKVMLRLADAAEQLDTLKESVKTALIYPALLVLVTVATLMLLMIFVVPQFTVMFSEMGRELPLATRIVSASGEALRGYWWLGALLALAAVRLIRHQWSQPVSRLRWERRLYGWPLLGEVLQRIQIALFARTLATLLGNGVPLLSALQIVRETLTSLVLRASLGRVGEGVKEGATLASQMASNDGFPPLAIHLVRVGEETGQLEAMLLQLAEILEREARVAVSRALALLEPLLIIGLGLIVGGIIVSILLAILSIDDLTL